MGLLIPGKPLLAQLDIMDTAGVSRVAPGSGPVITMRRNNAVETELVLSVTNPSVGLYLYYAAAVPAWSHGDQVILEADTGSTGVGAFAEFTVIDPAIAGAAMTLTGGASSALTVAVEAALLNDLDGQALLAAIGAKVQTLFDQGVDVPVATLVAQIAAAVLVNPANKLATDGTGRVTASNAIPSSGDNASAVAAAVLVNSANKLLTNSSGHVTSTNGGSGGSGATQLVVPIVTEGVGRLRGSPIQIYVREGMALKLTVKDATGAARDLSAAGNLEFCMKRAPSSVKTLADLRSYELDRNAEFELLVAESPLTGNNLGEVEFPIPDRLSDTVGLVSCSLRVMATGEVLQRVAVVVGDAA